MYRRSIRGPLSLPVGKNTGCEQRSFVGAQVAMQPGLEVLWSGGGVDLSIHLAPIALCRLAFLAMAYYAYTRFSFEIAVAGSLIDLLLAEPLSFLPSQWNVLLVLSYLTVVAGVVAAATFHL